MYPAFLALLVVAWGQSAIWGPRHIQEFVKAESLNYTKQMKKEMIFVDDASEAAVLAKRGIEAPHWMYVGNPRSSFPLVVSVDIDFIYSDIHWCPRRLYDFWCCGLRSKEPIYDQRLDDDLSPRPRGTTTAIRLR